MAGDAAPRQLLLVCGSTREGSSNLVVLQAVQELRLPGVRADLYDGLVGLPAFVPGQEPVPAAATDLLDRIGRADAVLFSTPEYAGGLPGTLKNLLDWTVGGGGLYEKPVAWLDVANTGRGEGARNQLRVVLGYVGARIVEDACVHVEIERAEGSVAAEERPRLARAVEALLSASEIAP